METQFKVLIPKECDNRVVDVPLYAWKTLATLIADRFNGKLEVHELTAAASPSHEALYWIVAVIPGDARRQAFDIMAALDEEINKLIETHTNTKVPHAR